MKKFIFLFVILFFNATQCFYHGTSRPKRKLKHALISLTNKSPIRLEVVWVEIGERGKTITRSINPGKTIVVELGEFGGYSTRNPAKVVYSPIPTNPQFKQEFRIDLPSSNVWAFTAVKLADILNNIWVPGVFKGDEWGKFGNFQYMNMHPLQLDKVMKGAREIQIIK